MRRRFIAAIERRWIEALRWLGRHGSRRTGARSQLCSTRWSGTIAAAAAFFQSCRTSRRKTRTSSGPGSTATISRRLAGSGSREGWLRRDTTGWSRWPTSSRRCSITLSQRRRTTARCTFCGTALSRSRMSPISRSAKPARKYSPGIPGPASWPPSAAGSRILLTGFLQHRGGMKSAIISRRSWWPSMLAGRRISSSRLSLAARTQSS